MQLGRTSPDSRPSVEQIQLARDEDRYCEPCGRIFAKTAYRDYHNREKHEDAPAAAKRAQGNLEKYGTEHPGPVIGLARQRMMASAVPSPDEEPIPEEPEPPPAIPEPEEEPEDEPKERKPPVRKPAVGPRLELRRKVLFQSPRSPGLAIVFKRSYQVQVKTPAGVIIDRVPGETIQFENGTYETDDPAIIAFLEGDTQRAAELGLLEKGRVRVYKDLRYPVYSDRQIRAMQQR